MKANQTSCSLLPDLTGDWLHYLLLLKLDYKMEDHTTLRKPSPSVDYYYSVRGISLEVETYCEKVRILERATTRPAKEIEKGEEHLSKRDPISFRVSPLHPVAGRLDERYFVNKESARLRSPLNRFWLVW